MIWTKRSRQLRYWKCMQFTRRRKQRQSSRITAKKLPRSKMITMKGRKTCRSSAISWRRSLRTKRITRGVRKRVKTLLRRERRDWSRASRNWKKGKWDFRGSLQSRRKTMTSSFTSLRICVGSSRLSRLMRLTRSSFKPHSKLRAFPTGLTIWLKTYLSWSCRRRRYRKSWRVMWLGMTRIQWKRTTKSGMIRGSFISKW